MTIEPSNLSVQTPSLTASDDARTHQQLQLINGETLPAAVIQSSDLLVVEQGLLGWATRLNDGRRAISAIYNAPDYIDLSAAYYTHNTHLIALTQVSLRLFSDPDFSWRDDTKTLRDVNDSSRRHLCRINRHCVDLATKTPVERVAAYFLLALERGFGASQGAVVDVVLNRTDLAAYLGMRAETLSRAVGSLRREKALGSHFSGQIGTVDTKRLREIADGGLPRRKMSIAAISKLTTSP